MQARRTGGSGAPTAARSWLSMDFPDPLRREMRVSYEDRPVNQTNGNFGPAAAPLHEGCKVGEVRRAHSRVSPAAPCGAIGKSARNFHCYSEPQIVKYVIFYVIVL